jgi:hypothetical protein
MRRPSGASLAAFAVYVLGAVVVTWPLVQDLGSSWYLSPARPFGDYTSVIAHLRELVDGLHNPFLPGRIEAFNAPDGLPILWVVNIASFASTLVLYVLALLFGATAGVGVFVLAGFALSALAMFLLVRRLTGNVWVALIVGWAFGFYPYVIANGEHPHHIHGWPFVLMAWRMLELAERPTRRNGVFAGLATLVLLGWTPYYILLGGVAYATIAVASLAVAARGRSLRAQLVPQAICAAIVLAFVVAIQALSLVDEGAAAVGATSTIQDLIAQSARPLNYLLPTSAQPLLGGWSFDHLTARGWEGHTEKQLYVGWTVIALALIGLVVALSRRVPPLLRALAVVGAAVVVVGGLFSGPPQVAVAGELVPLPAWFVHDVVPGWRIYSRFVIVVMLGLCLLAAVGLTRLAAVRRWGPVLVGAAAVLVPIDLWARHAGTVRTLEEPSIYATLRAQPDDGKAVAEYPLSPTNAAEDYDDLYRGRFHDRPLLNGYPPRTADEGRALGLLALEDPNTAGSLSLLGVGYVVLRNERPTAPGVPESGDPGRGFELLDRDGFGRLYAVRPEQPFAAIRSGFGAPEGGPGGRRRWQGDRTSAWELRGDCARGCDLRFVAESFGPPRRVTLTAADGRRVLSRTVSAAPRTVRARVRFDRALRLTLAVDPGPVQVGAVLGNGDPRLRALGLRDLVLEPARDGRGGL